MTMKICLNASCALLLAGMCITAGCKLPDAAEGSFQCEPDDPATCPAGYLCQARGGVQEFRCYSEDGPHCGDGILNDGETCDGDQGTDDSCAARGYWAGALACN